MLPVYQKFSNVHTAYIKSKSGLTLEERIQICSDKILHTLENAKELSIDERNEGHGIDESEFSSIDLDYETIHTEILENMILSENESGLSDFDEDNYGEYDEEENKKFFETTKIKTIIQKSIKSLFSECQEEDQFKPLAIQQKEEDKQIQVKIQKEEKADIENNINSFSSKEEEISTEKQIITKEEEDKKEIIKKFINEDQNEEIIEKKPINFKKYNYFTDPYSNYNNFTKKYKVGKNPQKRLRDIHPFLKMFNPKFLKKENIDKKIFRRFRNYIKKCYKKEKDKLIFSKEITFWKIFNIKNLLPPMKMNDNGKTIQFKSFNTNYLIWLFSKEGTKELFKRFSKEEGENIIYNFVKDYEISESNEPGIIKKLKQYLNKIPEIYSSPKNNCQIGINEELEDCVDTYLFSSYYPEENCPNSNAFQLNFMLADKKKFFESPYNKLLNNNGSNKCICITGDCLSDDKVGKKEEVFSDFAEPILTSHFN